MSNLQVHNQADHETDVLILGSQDVGLALAGSEHEVMDCVRMAYLAHTAGRTVLPHSTFLRFPNQSSNRIIALPAFIDSDYRAAGVKWIASFPSNVDRGLSRASAVIILNSPDNGRPLAILEASLISAKRTAASAAIAAQALCSRRIPRSFGLIGCGAINFETANFLSAAFPDTRRIIIFDTDFERAEKFGLRILAGKSGWDVRIAQSCPEVLASAELVSIATTAAVPHIDGLAECQPGATILHTSLRDIAPSVLFDCDNVTDDIDHVCRENTSLHLAEQIVGHRRFIRTTLGEILSGRARARESPSKTVIFSPFGLGILDLALGYWVARRSAEREGGIRFESFLPNSIC